MPDDEGHLPEGEQGRTRWKWRHSVVIVLVILSIGVLLANIAATTALSRQVAGLQKIQASSITSSAENLNNLISQGDLFLSHPVNPDTNRLSAFFADCEKTVDGWKQGQVIYPTQLSLDKGRTGPYSITIYTHSAQLPAEKMIPDTNSQSKPISVQCTVAARLTSIDNNSLVVDNAGWVLREFTPTGYVNWSWATMALASGSHALRLELRPAVTTQISPNGTRVFLAEGDSSLDTTTFMSRVDVHGSPFEDLNQKFNADWPIIFMISVAIGGGLSALLKWLRMFSRGLRDFGADRRRKQGESAHPGDQASNLNGWNDRTGPPERTTEDHIAKTE